jgi:hypothetical protein
MAGLRQIVKLRLAQDVFPAMKEYGSPSGHHFLKPIEASL